MRACLAIVLSTMVGCAIPALANDVPWPQLAPGEIETVDDTGNVPSTALAAAGLASAQARRDVHFTFFKAAHGHEFVIIAPCCGENGSGTSLFERDGGAVKTIALVMGNPLFGLSAQDQATSIKIDAGAVALRARIAWPECEQGVWGYYYRFNEADSPVLLSVIDTGCAHLGVRELYHALSIDVGHWWMQ